MKEYRYQKEFTKELFQQPTSEYRGAPFWAWNGKLEWDEMKQQIDCFKQMGFGGFHIHARNGLEETYLGKKYLEMVRKCTEYAKKENLLSWMYDEDRCPSGYAGGFLTENKKYRAHYLVLTPRTQAESKQRELLEMKDTHAMRSAEGSLLAVYDIQLDEHGMLKSFEQIEEGREAVGRKWYAYLESPAENPWYNYQTYGDTLNKEAMDQFIHITYDALKDAVGDYFETTVPSFFTDEPQFCHKTCLKAPEDDGDVFFPWTVDLTESYYGRYQEDLLKVLPLLVWGCEDGKEKEVRYRFHDHVTERFVEAFADNCGRWCKGNGVFLTGHMMGETTLMSQTESTGESMRSYRAFGIPGVDVLCDEYEYTVVKQAQSAARQYGRPGVLSELYGVTNWDFDFRGYKRQGDWQAAMGVTVRVPHLSWLTMHGESKRDYPASIHYQSPWAEKYHFVEDHFARVNTALTRGKGVVKVGVIHPIESYWINWGTVAQTGAIREQMEDRFQSLTKWLLLGQQDFDFICESTLPELCQTGGYPLNVGEMNYSVVIVPQCETLRKTTLERLLAFGRAGGKILILGEYPTRIEGSLSKEVDCLQKYGKLIPFEKIKLLEELETERVIDIRNIGGDRAENLIYQMRQEENCSWLFVAYGVKGRDVDVAVRQDISIGIKGNFEAECYDTLTGETYRLTPFYQKGKTILQWTLYQENSLLLRLVPIGKSDIDERKEYPVERKIVRKEVFVPEKAQLQLSMPNILVLDMAEYALDEEAYEPEEEILRIDNLLRKRLGWEPRQDEMAEPWAVPNEKCEHLLHLRYTIESETAVENAELALENVEQTRIFWDNKAVKNVPQGYFADRCIKTVRMPVITKGRHQLELEIPFGKKEGAEACYLLGGFCVALDGCEAVLKKQVHEVGYGNLAEKGFPFYGDNLVYRTEIHTEEEGMLCIHIPQYRGAMIEVSLDGQLCGEIIYAPYDCRIGHVPAGKHQLELKVWGTRFNCFGQLHLCNSNFNWYGPDSYRTQGDNWSYEYQLKPIGILTRPVVEEICLD